MNNIRIPTVFVLFLSVTGWCSAAFAEVTGTTSQGCPTTQPTPVISVNVAEPDMKIDNRISVSSLQNKKLTDTRKLFAGNVKSQVNGLTESGISVSTSAVMDGIVEKRTGTGCIWVKKLQVTVRPSFTVMIPDKYRNGSCGYRQIYIHEMKHVAAEQATVREFIPYLERDLKKTVSAIGISRNVPENMIDSEAKKISGRIAKSNTVSFDIMNDVRRARHENIDTLKEYETVSKIIHEQCSRIDNINYNE